MLFTLGADSQFGTLEGVISSLIDLKVFPNLRKEAISGEVCVLVIREARVVKRHKGKDLRVQGDKVCRWVCGEMVREESEAGECVCGAMRSERGE